MKRQEAWEARRRIRLGLALLSSSDDLAAAHENSSHDAAANTDNGCNEINTSRSLLLKDTLFVASPAPVAWDAFNASIDGRQSSSAVQQAHHAQVTTSSSYHTQKPTSSLPIVRKLDASSDIELGTASLFKERTVLSDALNMQMRAQHDSARNLQQQTLTAESRASSVAEILETSALLHHQRRHSRRKTDTRLANRRPTRAESSQGGGSADAAVAPDANDVSRILKDTAVAKVDNIATDATTNVIDYAAELLHQVRERDDARHAARALDMCAVYVPMSQHGRRGKVAELLAARAFVQQHGADIRGDMLTIACDGSKTQSSDSSRPRAGSTSSFAATLPVSITIRNDNEDRKSIFGNDFRVRASSPRTGDRIAHTAANAERANVLEEPILSRTQRNANSRGVALMEDRAIARENNAHMALQAIRRATGGGGDPPSRKHAGVCVEFEAMPNTTTSCKLSDSHAVRTLGTGRQHSSDEMFGSVVKKPIVLCGNSMILPYAGHPVAPVNGRTRDDDGRESNTTTAVGVSNQSLPTWTKAQQRHFLQVSTAAALDAQVRAKAERRRIELAAVTAADEADDLRVMRDRATMQSTYVADSVTLDRQPRHDTTHMSDETTSFVRADVLTTDASNHASDAHQHALSPESKPPEMHDDFVDGINACSALTRRRHISQQLRWSRSQMPMGSGPPQLDSVLVPSAVTTTDHTAIHIATVPSSVSGADITMRTHEVASQTSVSENDTTHAGVTRSPVHMVSHNCQRSTEQQSHSSASVYTADVGRSMAREQSEPARGSVNRHWHSNLRSFPVSQLQTDSCASPTGLWARVRTRSVDSSTLMHQRATTLSPVPQYGNQHNRVRADVVHGQTRQRPAREMPAAVAVLPSRRRGRSSLSRRQPRRGRQLFGRDARALRLNAATTMATILRGVSRLPAAHLGRLAQTSEAAAANAGLDSNSDDYATLLDYYRDDIADYYRDDIADSAAGPTLLPSVIVRGTKSRGERTETLDDAARTGFAGAALQSESQLMFP